MYSPVLKRRNVFLKRRKSTIKVDLNDEKECETEDVDDDLPVTQRFVSPQKLLATYHSDKVCPNDVLLCNSSSDLLLFY